MARPVGLSEWGAALIVLLAAAKVSVLAASAISAAVGLALGRAMLKPGREGVPLGEERGAGPGPGRFPGSK